MTFPEQTRQKSVSSDLEVMGLTQQDQEILAELVRSLFAIGNERINLFRKFNQHFNVSHYSQIPSSRFEEAINSIIKGYRREQQPLPVNVMSTDQVEELKRTMTEMVYAMQGIFRILKGLYGKTGLAQPGYTPVIPKTGNIKPEEEKNLLKNLDEWFRSSRFYKSTAREIYQFFESNPYERALFYEMMYEFSEPVMPPGRPGYQGGRGAMA